MKPKSKKKPHLMKMPKDIREYWESLDPSRALKWSDLEPSMMWGTLTKKEKDEIRKIKNR